MAHSFYRLGIMVACLALVSVNDAVKAEPVERVADYLIENQGAAGDWGEAGFTGECTAGLCRAYEVSGAEKYKEAAEKAGDFSLADASYSADDGSFGVPLYPTEAYALFRLSEIADDPAQNKWKTALEDFFDFIRLQAGTTHAFVDHLVSNYGVDANGTAVYDIARFTVAVGGVNDQDLDVWRNKLIELLETVNNGSDIPVTALAAAVWALEATGSLDETVTLGGDSPFLSGRNLSELPAVVAGLQADDGSFAWNFDGDWPGYTEVTMMCMLALEATGGYKIELEHANYFLRSAVSESGECYFLAGDPASGSAFAYGGETLEVIHPLLFTPFTRGDPNADSETNIGDVTYSLAYLFGSGEQPSCLDSADANDDGFVDLSDSIYLLLYLFTDGLPPAAPFEACSIDLTEDALNCSSYPLCE